MKKSIALFLLAACVLFAACSGTGGESLSQSQVAISSSSVAASSETTSLPVLNSSNLIDSSNSSWVRRSNEAIFTAGENGSEEIVLCEGDSFLGFTLSKLSVVYHYDELTYLEAIFQGDVTLTGSLHVLSEDEYMDYQTHFVPDEASCSKLPYATVDTRSIWFTLDDNKEALFYSMGIDPAAGTTDDGIACEIVISKYCIYFAHMGAANVATLSECRAL